jgi:hypothetical protein
MKKVLVLCGIIAALLWPMFLLGCKSEPQPRGYDPYYQQRYYGYPTPAPQPLR